MQNSAEKLYEFTYLASSELDDSGISDLKNEIDAGIVRLGGSIREHLETSKRRLAYEVKKAQTAYLVSEYITLTVQAKAELDKEMRFNSKILRHAFIALTEKKLTRIHEKKLAHLQSIGREKEKAAAKRASAPTPATAGVAAAVKVEKPAEEKKADIAEIERKLDEILGREL